MRKHETATGRMGPVASSVRAGNSPGAARPRARRGRPPRARAESAESRQTDYPRPGSVESLLLESLARSEAIARENTKLACMALDRASSAMKAVARLNKANAGAQRRAAHLGKEAPAPAKTPAPARRRATPLLTVPPELVALVPALLEAIYAAFAAANAPMEQPPAALTGNADPCPANAASTSPELAEDAPAQAPPNPSEPPDDERIEPCVVNAAPPPPPEPPKAEPTSTRRSLFGAHQAAPARDRRLRNGWSGQQAPRLPRGPTACAPQPLTPAARSPPRPNWQIWGKPRASTEGRRLFRELADHVRFLWLLWPLAPWQRGLAQETAHALGAAGGRQWRRELAAMPTRAARAHLCAVLS